MKEEVTALVTVIRYLQENWADRNLLLQIQRGREAGASFPDLALPLGFSGPRRGDAAEALTRRLESAMLSVQEPGRSPRRDARLARQARRERRRRIDWANRNRRRVRTITSGLLGEREAYIKAAAASDPDDQELQDLGEWFDDLAAAEGSRGDRADEQLLTWLVGTVQALRDILSREAALPPTARAVLDDAAELLSNRGEHRGM